MTIGLWKINLGSLVVITAITEEGIYGHSMSGRIPTLLWDVNGKILRESTPILYDLAPTFEGFDLVPAFDRSPAEGDVIMPADFWDEYEVIGDEEWSTP